MIRLLMFLFGKNYEECKSCQTLKEQLEFERNEKRQLTETLLEILKPKVVEAPPVTINTVQQTAALFSRRRAALEEADRQKAQIIASSKNIAKADEAVEKLEKELGVQEEEKGA